MTDHQKRIGTTLFLVVSEAGTKKHVKLTEENPVAFLGRLTLETERVRYSPVFQAFVSPDADDTRPPNPTRIGFLFSTNPYWALGFLKSELEAGEFENTFFTEGLASIIVVDAGRERTAELAALTNCIAWEWWECNEGELMATDSSLLQEVPNANIESPQLVTTACLNVEVAAYVEQINAAVVSLWLFYARFAPTELQTLRAIVKLSEQLIQQFTRLDTSASATDPVPWQSLMEAQKGRNAIHAALVEIAAALSYAVTQGTTGVPPILANAAPFPHHALLGIGSAVRAITNFTRYIEHAFAERSAARVVADGYSVRREVVPSDIPEYASGQSYALPGMGFRTAGQSPPVSDPHGSGRPAEQFDLGGRHVDDMLVPLLAHFSLRHGFKESKFSVTAASESLTAEHWPPWTLLTLSHEVMHSTVRGIFQALLGSEWDAASQQIGDRELEELVSWYDSNGTHTASTLTGLRNAVLLACIAMARAAKVIDGPMPSDKQLVDSPDLQKAYREYRQRAIELFVHFHDFYFVYGGQVEIYAMSLWASWTCVAAPLARPEEYLIRTLATLACGSGAHPREAFNRAAEILDEAMQDLEGLGITSPVFHQIRAMLKDDRERLREVFKVSYYLIDQIRLFFASPSIAAKIDGLVSDPRAITSTTEEYSGSIFTFADSPDERVSPTRYSLSSFWHSLRGDHKGVDGQWLTARNLMVVSSWRPA